MSFTSTAPERGLKVPHLVLGLLYLGVAGAWLLLATGVLQVEDLAYLAPGVLVVAGAIGLLAMALDTRARDRTRDKVNDQSPFIEPGNEPGDEPDRTTPFPYDKEIR